MLILILKFVTLFAFILAPLIPRNVKKMSQGVKPDRSASDFSVDQGGNLVNRRQATGINH